MPGIPATSVVQVRIDYFHFGQRLMNVLHYTCVDEATAGTIASETQDIADVIASNGAPGSIADKLVTVLPSTVDITQMRVQVVHPVRQAYRFTIVGRAGGRSASQSANYDAVATKRTDSSGDDKQSNFYLPGLPAEDVLDGFLKDAYITLLETNLAWLKLNISTPNAGVYSPVIFHRLAGTVTPITSVFVHNTIRVMTRRTVGRGE